MNIRFIKGFTLIELLVVIAIIGVLATVVLASLNSSRTKASDAAIKSQMKELGKQTEVYSLVHGAYSTNSTIRWDDDAPSCRGAAATLDGTMFGSNSFDTTVRDLVLAVSSKSSGATSGNRVFCAASDNSWAFAAPLFDPSGSNTGWCIDSSGNSKEVSFDMTIAGNPLHAGSNVARCP